MNPYAKKVLALISILALLAVMGIAITALNAPLENRPEIQTDDFSKYKETIQKKSNLNEPLLLSSEDDEQSAIRCGNEYDVFYVASLCWEGEMRVTALSADLIDNRATLGDLAADSRIAAASPDSQFLKIILQIENISAEGILGDPEGIFNISTIGNLYINDSKLGNDILYFDGTPEGVRPDKDYYQYYLPIGETQDYTLIYEIPSSIDSIGSIALGMGANSSDKYQIILLEENE